MLECRSKRGRTGAEAKTGGEKAQRMLMRRAKASSTEGRASSCRASPENGPPQALPPSVPPIGKAFATCRCNNMVTICPGATAKLNTLDRMVHPDVLARNIAPLGFKAELPPHLMGMRSPSLPPSHESYKGESRESGEDPGSGFRDLCPTQPRGKEVTWSLWWYCLLSPSD